MNHFAHEGMTKRAIGGHYGQAPQLGAMAQANKIEAYNLPLGSISRMIRAAAGKLPGHITTVGYGTMADPKHGGGKINTVTKEDLVEEIEVLGKKYLIYKAVPINVAIIRGTTADPMGNITMERESLYVDNLIQAMAARASGGIVLVQVERVATENSLKPREVKIPGTLVDGVVVASPENHWMSYITPYNPGFTSEIKTPVSLSTMEMDERKIIARRGLLEVVPNQVVNLGIGMAEGVALVAEEEKILNYFTLTTEPGVHGGVGASGHDFGPAKNYDAILDMNQQFDFYNGGGLDVCFLGMAQVTATGDVNVTRVGPALKGPGGFIDISQSTKRVNLVGTFTTGGLEIAVEGGKLVIKKEGSIRKFVKSIPEITFSGSNAVSRNQLVHYITERCVFTLTPEGLELIEIAPGIDLQTQILDLMEFKPVIKGTPRLMDARIFGPTRMKLLESLYSLDMSTRLNYNAETRTLYIDLHGVSVTTPDIVTDIITSIADFFEKNPKLAKKVDVFVNYDGFDCREELVKDFTEKAHGLEAKYYGTVRRISSAGFARHKLADSMKMSLQKSYNINEVYDLLKSMGLAVSRQTVATLCARYDTDGEKGVISSEELASIVEAIKA